MVIYPAGNVGTVTFSIYTTTMTTTKRLGICMDHSRAHIMEYATEPTALKTLESQFTHEAKEESLEKSEHLAHNKEQHQLAAYYKELGGIIREYNDVLLFGPTQAKTELFNILRADHNFEKINIEVLQTDKMTENEQHAFVRDHFSKTLI